jgi:hypothetical protein
MIRVSVMYPSTDGAGFDLDYWLTKHIPMEVMVFIPPFHSDVITPLL